jgi:hypothetical protein
VSDNVVPLNQHIDFNLDTLEREGKGPFRFVLDGVALEMTDPHELDFKVLLEISHPTMFLKYALSEEAKKALSEKDVPGWKFNKLVEAYMDFYGLNQAQGKGWLS